MVSRWLTPAYAAEHPDLVARLEAMIAAATTRATPPAARWSRPWTCGRTSAGSPRPTLVVSGWEDPALPPEHQKLIADSIPGAELLTVSPGAHLANLEQPLQVTGALLGHFDAAGRRPMSRSPDARDDERRAAGMATRREVLGDAWVDRAVAGTTPFTADFQDFITRTAWGDLWQRPGLARRDRSLMTLSITIALRHWEEFALHVRAAKNNGLTDEEIGEVIQHAAVYAGVPAANHAFKVAAPILEELRGTSV